jgi:hypothetical protein
VLDTGDAEGLGARSQLVHPGRGERAPAGEIAGGQTELAVRRDDDDDPVALGGGARHRPRGQQRLVVGVCMEGQERVRHSHPSWPMAQCLP